MTANKDVFDQAMTRGHSAAWDQQWERAIAFYRAALTEFPDESTALSSLGFALLKTEQPEEALRAYQRAAAKAPTDPVAPEKTAEILELLGRTTESVQTFLAVADIHLKRRDVQKAMESWSRVIRLAPDNLTAHSRLALALERTGRARQAALEYLEVARVFQNSGDRERAAQAAFRAQQLDTTSPEPREALAMIKRGQQIPRLAPVKPTGPLPPPEAKPEKVAEPVPAEAETAPTGSASPIAAAMETALAHVAQMLFDGDADTTKASASVAAMAKGSTGRSAPEQIAQAMVHLGHAISNQTSNNPAGAVSHYASALELGLDHPVVRFMMGALLLETKLAAESIPHLEAATTRDDLSLGAFCALGEAQLQIGQTRQAFASLLEALKRLDLSLVLPARQDALAETYEGLAESLAAKADAELEQLLPGLQRLLIGVGWENRAKQARRQLDAASEEGQQAPLADLIATPGTDRMLDSMRRIEALISRRLWATAMEEAYHALSFSPYYLPLHIRMAEILSQEGKSEAAAQKYGMVAEAYRMRNDAGRAARILEQMLNLMPWDVGTRARLIALLTQQGKLEKALNHYVELGNTFYQLADLETALAKYREALQVAEQPAVDRQWAARILHRIGDIEMQRFAWREALQTYERIKSLAPGDDKARIALLDLCFRLGNKQRAVAELDEYLQRLLGMRAVSNATTLLEELNHSYPDEMPLISRLGRLYQDQGRIQEAIEQYDRLGDLQLGAGQTTEARETVRAIIALGPDDPVAYQQLLEQLNS
jgi:tetratricopeptide (TPR) repeat protein